MIALLALAVAALPGAASAASEPALTAPRASLEAALECHGVDSPKRRVTLLVPGTGLTPESFSYNYARFLRLTDRPYCTVALPEKSLGDAQVAAEYIVHAVRAIHVRSRRRVQVLGFSQGGMLPRWGLKFWPSTRFMVGDLVGLAPSNHGTYSGEGLCASPGGCAPAVWQQRAVSNFIRTLNAGTETYDRISYSVAYSSFDQVVTPNTDERTGSSPVRTGPGYKGNRRLQDKCPANTADHLATGTSDPVAHAIAFDAIDHDGPAFLSRIPASVCTRTTMPGIDESTFARDQSALTTGVLQNFARARRVRSEPPLACYARSACPASRLVRVELRLRPRTLVRGRRTRVAMRATLVSGDGDRAPAPGAYVSFAGRTVRLADDGTGAATVTLRRLGRRTARLIVPSAGTSVAHVRVVTRR